MPYPLSPEALEQLGLPPQVGGSDTAEPTGPYEQPHHEENTCKHCGAVDHEPGQPATCCASARDECEQAARGLAALGLDANTKKKR